jgi:hypothetical protein
MPVLLHDAALLDERQTVLLCCHIGGRAPRTGRKPDRLGTFGSRLLYVPRNGGRRTEHNNEVDGTWDIRQAGICRKASDVRPIRAHRNDVVSFMCEVSHD